MLKIMWFNVSDVIEKIQTLINFLFTMEFINTQKYQLWCPGLSYLPYLMHYAINIIYPNKLTKHFLKNIILNKLN